MHKTKTWVQNRRHKRICLIVDTDGSLGIDINRAILRTLASGCSSACLEIDRARIKHERVGLATYHSFDPTRPNLDQRCAWLNLLDSHRTPFLE